MPKKGHVCPYQPKLTRRPGEPLPEMRCAAIQVEMDEVRSKTQFPAICSRFDVEAYILSSYFMLDVCSS